MSWTKSYRFHIKIIYCFIVFYFITLVSWQDYYTTVNAIEKDMKLFRLELNAWEEKMEEMDQKRHKYINKRLDEFASFITNYIYSIESQRIKEKDAPHGYHYGD